MPAPISSTESFSGFPPGFYDLDPGLLTMMVSLMNLDATYGTARVSLRKDENVFQTLTKIAPLAGKLAGARQQVIRQELQALDGQLETANELKSRYVDNTTVNETDNQRFEHQAEWAIQRGLPIRSPVRIITETIKTAVTDLTESRLGNIVDLGKSIGTAVKSISDSAKEFIEETVSRLVADSEILGNSVNALADYRNQLVEGEVDNSAVRQAIGNNPLIAQIQQSLAESGQSSSLNTLTELADGVRNLDGWKNHLVADIHRQLDVARTVHSRLEKSSIEWDAHKKDLNKADENRHSQEFEEQQFEKRLRLMLRSENLRTMELQQALEQTIASTEEFLAELESPDNAGNVDDSGFDGTAENDEPSNA